MAKNAPTGDGRRQGAVRQRSQVETNGEQWTKRGPDGKFMDQKSDESFKGVRKEK